MTPTLIPTKESRRHSAVRSLKLRVKHYAYGIRNAGGGLAINPQTGDFGAQ